MNKPLTIEELKALEVGDWMWVVLIDKNFDFEMVTGYYQKISEFNYADYGTKWLAYKNKEQAECGENYRVISNKEFWELSNRFTKKELDERIEFAKKQAVKEFASRLKQEFFFIKNTKSKDAIYQFTDSQLNCLIDELYGGE